MPEENSIDEQYRNHSPLEGSDAGAQNATPVGSHSPECGSQHGLRERTGGHPDDSRDTRPDRATRFVETAFGILSYSQLAPLLGERVTHLEESVQAEEFRSSPLDENLILEFHRRICGDLTPDWAVKMAHCGSHCGAIDATCAAPIADAHAGLRARLASAMGRCDDR